MGIVAAALLAVDAWWMVGHWGGDVTSLAVADVIGAIAPWMAAYGCFRRSWMESGRIALGWELLGYACIAWALGELYWIFDELVLQAGTPVPDREVPFPGVADLGYLAFLGLAIGALVILPSKLWTVAARVRILLDGFILGLGLLSIAWTLLLQERVFSATLSLGDLLAIVYPAGDLVLLVLALLAGMYAAPHERRRHLNVMLAIDVLALGDFAFWIADLKGVYRSGGPIDLAWPAGFFLLGLAALTPGPPTADLHWAVRPPSPVVRWLPLAPLALAGLVLASLLSGAQLDVIGFAAAVGAVVLVPARELAWTRERRHWDRRGPS